MAHVLWILPVLLFIGFPAKSFTNDKFIVESSSQDVIYEETENKTTTLSYTIRPWPPDWRSNSSDYEAYKDVKIQFRNDSSNTMLCQANYHKGLWVNESLSDSCTTRSGGRVEDFTPGLSEWVSFTITYITLWDMTDYSLEVTDSFGDTYRGNIDLTVKARPKPEVSERPKGDLNEAQQVELTCITRNTWPPPQLVWLRGKQQLESEKHIATTWYGESRAKLVWKATKEDHGQSFVCKAQNDAGQPRTASYSMSVLFAPEITIDSCRDGYAVREGRGARLICRVNANPSYSLTEWNSPTGKTLQSNETILEITNITRQQAGDYTCKAWNSKGPGSQACLLDVHYGVTVKLPPSVPVKEFQTVNISCETDGHPKAVDYVWKLKEGSVVVSTNKTLEISSVRPENGGLYTCSATNILAGNQKWTDTGTVNLLVEYTPRLANYSLTKYAGQTGSTAILECWAHGYPAPNVYWKFNGRDVVNDSRHVIETSQSVSRMNIKFVADADFGVYTCSALNSEGGQNFQIQLLKPGKPDSPQKCDVTKVGDREVSLTCVQGYDGGDQMTFSVSRSAEGQQGSDWSEVEVTWPEIYALWSSGQPLANVKVKGFGPNTNYTLRVYGDNKFGKSDEAFAVFIRTADGPPLPTPAPPNVGAIVGGVLGGLLVVIIIVGAALYVRKYGTPEVPKVMRRRPRDDRQNIMNRYSDDVGRRYADRMSWTPDAAQKETHIRSPVAEPNAYVLHPGMREDAHGAYMQESTGYMEDGDYRDYGNHGDHEYESVGYGYSDGANGYDEGYAYANDGYANGGFEDGSEEYPSEEHANSYGHTHEGYVNYDNNQHDIQVAAELHNPDLLRHNRGESRAHAPDPRHRQSNLAGMGALAGSHVMLHAQQGGQTGNGNDESRYKRRSQEPLMEGVSGLETRWEFPRHQLSFREKLGEGLFGEVWRAYADNLGGRHGRLNVAIKLLKASCPPEEQSSLWRELEVLKMLRPHPNVVALLGACSEKEPLFVMLEYCSKGNLLDFLRNNRSIPRGMHPGVRGVTLTTRSLTCYVMQIANGMEFISTNGLLHRDLACRNILLDDRLTCKISDFGFARDIAHTRQYEGKTRRRLPLRWMAPESLYDCLYSTNSDVWAFGVLIWEVMTLGSSPYPGMTGHDVMELINTGFRMEKPLHCSSSMYSVMRDCWRPAPNQRPSWSTLGMRIAAILEDLDDNPDEIIRVNDMEGSMFAILTNPPGEKC